MGFLSSLGSIFGLESGIGASVPQVGPGPNTNAREGEADALLRQALGSIQQGYGQALSTTAGIGAANAQMIQDQGAQGAGSLLSRLSSSGMLNSSVAPNLARGIASDQRRNLLQNNADIGGLLGNLQAGRGQAVAGAQSGIAQNLIGRGQRDRAFFLNREGLRLGRDQFVSQARQNRSASIGDTVGNLAGMYL
jgi:hypothetical protein